MNHEGLAEELVKLAEHLVGGYGILFLIAFVTFLFRDFVTNYAAGLRFMFGSDFDVDDIVWISGNKKARIIRQTPTKTVFHMLETDRKLVVPNTALYGLKIEKALPGANEGRDL
tara:strand:- start:709 stop:1050 length:342 start_codon:yes stop_codon:yes gene_type:complete